MTDTKGASSTPDEDLGLYQLHCRYAILEGLDMPRAADLWREMKGNFPSRAAHMTALFERLRTATTTARPGSAEPTTSEPAAEEGEPRVREAVRRRRDQTLTQCRLELDDHRCAHCGFRKPDRIVGIEGPIELQGTIVEVHHVDPLNDGVRTTRLSDLVTLCPTCHSLLHAIGQTLSLSSLPATALLDHLAD